MDEKRIIACLDIKDGAVVKGVGFTNLRHAGDPILLAQQYDRDGADELVLLDIGATVENRGPMLTLVEELAGRIEIPITVGGGIRSSEDASSLLKRGASKVSISSKAVEEPSLIRALADEFGPQRIVCAIDAKRRADGRSWEVVTRGGRHATGLDCIQWVVEVAQLGAGEILLTSMDSDGAKSGYDLALYQAVCKAVNLPIIASGGAGTMAHFAEVFTESGVAGALGASIFHFQEVEIPKLKIFLTQCGIPMRNRR
jgi:cyclase